MNKKSITTIIAILLLLPSAMMAKNRDISQMDSIAKSVFGERIKIVSKTNVSPKNGIPMTSFGVSAKASELLKVKKQSAAAAREAFYVYSFLNGQPGYVIVSTDDRLPEIIAFSDADFFTPTDIPDAMRDMLQAYSDLLNGTNAGRSYAPAASQYEGTSVAPLLGKIAFDQSEPYNNRCPLYNGTEKTYTGCAATAMAQIMAYYKYPNSMTGENISYTTKSYGIAVTWDCANTVFDWDNMADTYTGYIADFSGTLTTTATQYMSFESLELASYNQITITNFKPTDISGGMNADAQFILADNQGKFIRPVGNTNKITLSSGQYFTTFYLNHSMPSDIADGTYRLYVGVRKTDTQDWSISKNAGEGNDYLTAIKNGSEYTILEKTFSCGYTDKQAEAVATLSAACGAAALMDYGTNSSNAYSTDYGPALCKYMGYDESLNFIEASYFTESGWIERIQNELLSNRPILCSGRSENNFGHAFIIDGYEYRDGSPYFHVNWGWNGFSNGYFLINVLQPSEAGIGGSTENYGYDLTLIMDIKPDNDKDDGFVFGATSVTTDASSANVGDRVSVSATELCNRSPYEFAGKIQLYAVDEMQNEFVIGTYMTISSLKLLSYYPSVSNSLQIPTAIPTGNYTLQLRAIADGSSVENAVLTPTCPQIHITNNDMFIVGQAVSAENSHVKKLVYDSADKCYKNLEDGTQEQPIMMATGQPFVFATNLFYQEDENVPVSLVDSEGNSTEADTYMADGTNHDTQYCNFLSKNTSATAGYGEQNTSVFNLPTGEYYIRLYADGDQAYYLIRRAYSFSYCDSENKIENYNTWKTFCDYHAVVVPDDVDVLYVNSSDNTNNEVTLKKYPLFEPTEGVRVLPAGAAVILARTTDGNEAKPSMTMDYYAEPNFSESSYSEKPTANLLKGQIHSAKLEREADGKANFVFGRKLNADNKYVVGFYYAGDYNCPINLAYLQLDKNSIGDNAESKGWRLTLDDSETNGISHLTNGSEASDDGYYTLQGVKVTTPKAKGIYVHKGNKIIIK